MLSSQANATPTAAATRHRLYSNLGAALFRVGRYEDARAMFLEAHAQLPLHAGTLANLARVTYLLEDHATAQQLAWRAVGANANEAGAWALLVELGAIDGEQEGGGAATARPHGPPSQILSSADFLTGIAAAAIRSGDYAKASNVLRTTLVVERPADRLYLLAYTLFAPVQTPMRLVGPPDPRLAEVEVLTSEALDELPDDEFSILLEQLLLLRGSARRLLGELKGAAEDAQKALQLHPDAVPGRWRSACLYAAVRLDQELPDDVIGVLNLVSPDDRPAQLHVMRARAYAVLGRTEDVGHAIDDAFAAAERVHKDGLPDTESEPRWGMALACVEIALEAGLSARAAEIHERVSRSAGWLWALFAGRIAIARGDDDAGLALLRDAAQQADDDARPRVYFEVASRLAQLGRFRDAIEAYESGDAWKFGEVVRPGYIAALMEAGRYDQVGELLQSLEEESSRAAKPLPAWALPSAAAIAEQRADLPAAAAHLARLVAARPNSVNAHLRLAQVYMRMGDSDAAGPVFLALVGKPELSSRDRMILASMLFMIGDHARAIREAYYAMRAAEDAPDALEIEQGYIHLMLQAEQIGALERPTAVGPEVQVTLRREVGRAKRVIRVVSEGPLDFASDEFLHDDPVISPLIGRAKGEVIVLPDRKSRGGDRRKRSGEPTRYRIAALDNLPGLEYGRLMQTLASSPTQQSGLRAFSLGKEGTVGYLMPILHELHSMSEREERVFALYDEHLGLPLGTIAMGLGRPLNEAYVMRVERGERLYTEFGDTRSLERSVAAAANTTPLVLTRSALVTAELLWPEGVDLYALMERLGRQLLAPQRLLDELEEERRALQLAVRQGTTRLGVGPAGFVSSATTPEQTARQGELLVRSIAWVRRVATVPIRSLASISPAAQRLGDVLGFSSVDALDAAGSYGATLYADDLGLRRFETAVAIGVQGCSTWALVTAAHARGLLKPREARRAVAALVRLQHYFVPLSAELLAGLVSDEAHQVTASTRLVFRRLSDPAIDAQTAIDVAAQTLQLVALAGIGASALGEVTQTCLLELTDGRSPTLILNALAGRVQALFRLLHPQLLKDVLERIAQFKVAKRIAGSLQQ
jgi:tetratricopeptide (TPR) repeat protein